MPLLNTKTKRVILASQSPRRIELLRKIITDFEVQVSDVDENLGYENPNRFVVENSKQKALYIAQRNNTGIIIGADSIVVLENKILGKPENIQDAIDMLNFLSGNWHQVFTGFTVINKEENKIITGIEVTRVKFKNLDSWEIVRYIDLEHPFDKAGSYGIQDGSAAFVERIEGCFYNVMGLPIAKLYTVLLPLFKP